MCRINPICLSRFLRLPAEQYLPVVVARYKKNIPRIVGRRSEESFRLLFFEGDFSQADTILPTLPYLPKYKVNALAFARCVVLGRVVS